MSESDYKKEYWKQYTRHNTLKENANYLGVTEPDLIETLIDPLEPMIRKANGKINWMWVVFNIGKIVARLLLASDIQKGQAANNIKSLKL